MESCPPQQRFAEVEGWLRHVKVDRLGGISWGVILTCAQPDWLLESFCTEIRDLSWNVIGKAENEKGEWSSRVGCERSPLFLRPRGVSIAWPLGGSRRDP